MVHRPKYDDWSWAKGKTDPGEAAPVTAARETLEETGLQVHLGRPLPGASYTVLDREGQPDTKEVHYWAAEVVGGTGELENEIDEVRWLDVVAAHDRLDYARDRDQLRALVRADAEGDLTTWPLVLVRHAKSRPRDGWGQDDRQRPLDARGEAQARALVPLLAAYGVSRLVTSSSRRCVDTMAPYAASVGRDLKLRDGLSEEGFAADPSRAAKHLHRTLERGRASTLCSHGPVLPSLLGGLRDLVDLTTVGGRDADRVLAGAAAEAMGKGEALVCHVVSTGVQARVVAVERHPARG